MIQNEDPVPPEVEFNFNEKKLEKNARLDWTIEDRDNKPVPTRMVMQKWRDAK